MKIYALAPEERPDFRLVIAYLWPYSWRDYHKVDSDGNSYNPASREWTELYIHNWENTLERVNISPIQQSPLILEVESELDYLAARTAYFLSYWTQGKVSTSLDGDYEKPESLLGLVGDMFDIEEAIQRVNDSPFSRATLDDPYPNLREK